MTVASVASRHCKKAVKLGLSLFCSRFNSSKCKTMTKMAVARIKLLRNKREVVVRQMRRDIAMLLESKQDATARVRVEHVIREQNIMAANEFIELFCELIVARLPIIAKQRECPADLKEGISSVIFAAPRCSDIPELLAIRDVFEKKYGKDFVSAATDLRPNAGVNRSLIDKLSVRTPSGEVKLKVMREIAKEYQVEWDTKESEMELLKPPEERIEGPTAFISAATLPIKPIPNQPGDQNNPTNKLQSNGDCDGVGFENAASAAEAAAEAAKKAIAAAEAAAYLSGKERRTSGNSWNGATVNDVSPQKQVDQFKVQKCATQRSPHETSYYTNRDTMNYVNMQKIYRRHSYNTPAQSDVKFDESDCDEEMEMEQPPNGINLQSNQPPEVDIRRTHRRHSYNVPSSHSDIKFDGSDRDDDGEIEYLSSKEPPSRPAPQTPGVHPKLPDYDTLAARFEALKYRKS